SFGSAELLEEVWGVRPGAVTPFGAINDEGGKVCVVLDETMMRHERLNFHPLSTRAPPASRARAGDEFMANVSSAIAPQSEAASSVKDVTTASFRADVLTASTRQPVL